jgi:cytochrome c-type biogenesis protein CcmH
MLSDPALEARARDIGRDLRCLVCQNQSIDDSDAELAHDLRLLVRRRLAAGDSDQQVKQFIVDRYGDYVLLRPPLKPATLVLWLGPAALLMAGLAGAMFYYRRRGETKPLTAEEKQRLAALLESDKENAR